MRTTKYTVILTESERAHLRTLIGQGTAPARRLTHARILLKADQGEGGTARWSSAVSPGSSATGASVSATSGGRICSEGCSTWPAPSFASSSSTPAETASKGVRHEEQLLRHRLRRRVTGGQFAVRQSARPAPATPHP